MRLRGFALLDQRHRLERGRGLGAAVGRDRREAAEELRHLAVLGQVIEVADQERATARTHPLAPPEGQDPVARERPQMVRGPEHGPAEGMLAEGRAVDQVLGQHRRLVLRACDLLDDDAALTVELLGVDLRATHEVRQQIERLGGDLGAEGDVERDQIVRRVGVQHRAHRLRGLIDLAVVVELLAALEHEMLQEMGHPVLLRAFRARAGVERDQRGRGPRGELHAVQRQAIWQGGTVDARHSNEPTRHTLQGTLRSARTLPRTLGGTTNGCNRTTSPPPPASRSRPSQCGTPSARHGRGGLLQQR